MHGYIDLHCHFVPGIDDGARSEQEGVALLQGLYGLGFSRVIATPHMRPGMFDNEKAALLEAFERMAPIVMENTGVPEIGLSSEHYFDDVVFQRILEGQVLPYPGGKAILLEFYESNFPTMVEHRLFDIHRRGLLPVIAHPERYRALWKKPQILERLVDLGAAALLDVAALAGKYGREPRRAAEELLEMELYHAACSDAHRPKDVEAVREGMRLLEKRAGEGALQFYFTEGPQALLQGARLD